MPETEKPETPPAPRKSATPRKPKRRPRLRKGQRIYPAGWQEKIR